MRLPALLGAIFAGLAVMLGAFGAHMLKDSISPDRLAIFKTGTDYQFAHGLALLLLAALQPRLACPHRSAATAWLFVAGTVIFSGSLYALALTDVKGFGMVTPVGGLCFIAGWLVFAINAAKSSEAS